MKKLAYLIMISLIVGACSRAIDEASVTLILDNANPDEVELTLLEDFIGFNQTNLKPTMQEDGSLVFTFEPANPQFAYLRVGSRRLTLFTDKDSHSTISADLDDWSSTLSFSGTFATENSILRQHNETFVPEFNQNQIFAKLGQTDREGFIVFLDAMVEKGETLLAEGEETGKVSRAFRQLYMNDIVYNRYNLLINYENISRYFMEDPAEVPDYHYDFLEDALDFDNSYFNSRMFRAFLQDYLEYYAGSNPDLFEVGMDRNEMSLLAAEMLFTGKPKEFVKANVISSMLSWGNFHEAESMFFEFRDSRPHKPFLTSLEAIYYNALRVSPGQPAPEFELTDIDGNIVTLADFQGKVIYLDFWASWCGPCMREVPYARQLKERFDGVEDLVFLYISVDTDLNAWRSTIEEHQIQGVHLNIPGMRSPLAEDFNIRGVPTFFIIDREGVIFDNRPPRPSSGDQIDETLRTALEA